MWSRRAVLRAGAGGGVASLLVGVGHRPAWAVDEYDALRARWVGFLVGTGYDPSAEPFATKLAQVDSAAGQYRSTMAPGPAGLWPDLPLGTVSGNITCSFNRLGTVADGDGQDGPVAVRAQPAEQVTPLLVGYLAWPPLRHLRVVADLALRPERLQRVVMGMRPLRPVTSGQLDGVDQRIAGQVLDPELVEAAHHRVGMPDRARLVLVAKVTLPGDRVDRARRLGRRGAGMPPRLAGLLEPQHQVPGLSRRRPVPLHLDRAQPPFSALRQP